MSIFLSRTKSVLANFWLIRSSFATRSLKSSTTAAIASIPPRRSYSEPMFPLRSAGRSLTRSKTCSCLAPSKRLLSLFRRMSIGWNSADGDQGDLQIRDAKIRVGLASPRTQPHVRIVDVDAGLPQLVGHPAQAPRLVEEQDFQYLVLGGFPAVLGEDLFRGRSL